MCKAVRKKAHPNDNLGETDVLGVRIRFPHTRQNDRAIIKPQFEFHAYNTNGQFANVTNGVVVNVGLIRDVSVWVKGRNYPYDFAARLWDQEMKTHEFFFGNLLFENWRKLTWVNPNYIDQVKDRVLIRHPLYPKDVPYMRFQSFVIYRNMDQIGGDFILYVKNLSMVYERYVETIAHDDIDDEEQWGIMRQRAQKQMDRETKKLADKADIYRSEMRRLDKGN
jgi:hypothetical protein